MKPVLLRIATTMLSAAARLLPASLAPWGRAMVRELAEIEDAAEALKWASGCLYAVLGLALAARTRSLCAAARTLLFAPSTRRFLAMNLILANPRLLGLICGALAVAAGLAHMAAAGAPSSYLLVNLAALVLGATLWLALGRAAVTRPAGGGAAILALSVPLLLTAFFGLSAGGASRWVSVGPLTLQLSLIVVPVMLVLYARQPNATGTAGLLVAALALALQPDRAMAGVLIAGLAATLVARPGRLPFAAATASILAFAWTLLIPDGSSAVPFVDRILYTAFDVHPLAGAAVALGSAALLLPALAAAWNGAPERPTLLAFGGCWLGIVVAALLRDYPTPVVGYGGSAVLGYLLSVALLPGGSRQSRSADASDAAPISERDAGSPGTELRVPHPA